MEKKWPPNRTVVVRKPLRNGKNNPESDEYLESVNLLLRLINPFWDHIRTKTYFGLQHSVFQTAVQSKY